MQRAAIEREMLSRNKLRTQHLFPWASLSVCGVSAISLQPGVLRGGKMQLRGTLRCGLVGFFAGF